jgi:transcriptional regulator with XRE-family HTH domain
MQQVGIYLKQKREEKQLTQFQVAKKLGYGSAQFISNMERGVSGVPMRSIKKVIELFDLPAEEFIDLILEGKRQQIKKSVGSRVGA